jgi:predicted NBD/HSP70 family sugar kinase
MKTMRNLKSTADLKKQNILEILLAIRTNSALTKPEIGKHISATRVTAHNLINEMIDRGLLMENGTAESNGGRKASIYKLNPKQGYIIAQYISSTGIQTEVYRLGFEKIYQNNLVIDTTYSKKVLNSILEEIRKATKKSGLSFKHCLGIGVSVVGLVSSEDHAIKTLIHIPGWEGIKLQNIIAKEFKVPVFCENDKNANALAMKWTGLAGKEGCAIFLTMSMGMGVGILFNGVLFYGSHARAGELGHTIVQPAGPLCRCGNRGCLETMFNYNVIIDTAKKRLRNPKICNIKQVIELAKNGNPQVLEIVEQLTTYMSIALDNVIKAYDPDVIIVENELFRELKNLFDRTVEKTYSLNRFIDPERLRVIVNEREDINIIGAAALVEEHLFHSMDNNPLLERLNLTNKIK